MIELISKIPLAYCTISFYIIKVFMQYILSSYRKIALLLCKQLNKKRLFLNSLSFTLFIFLYHHQQLTVIYILHSKAINPQVNIWHLHSKKEVQDKGIFSSKKRLKVGRKKTIFVHAMQIHRCHSNVVSWCVITLFITHTILIDYG